MPRAPGGAPFGLDGLPRLDPRDRPRRTTPPRRRGRSIDHDWQAQPKCYVLPALAAERIDRHPPAGVPLMCDGGASAQALAAGLLGGFVIGIAVDRFMIAVLDARNRVVRRNGR